MGLPVTSPDISVLDFSILYDISGATPTIRLTNTSTVINPTLLTWWYTIYTPSGTPIHVGTLATPDVLHLAWTTLNIPSGSWPQIFGNPPCSQVEFSPGVPYAATLFVKDSAGNTFSITKNTTICTPAGNVSDSCGNFGVAAIDVTVKCQDVKIYAVDNTNYSYQNVLIPSVSSSTWTLTYPPNAAGSVPANATASNASFVYFPFGYGGDGYNIYLNSFAQYDMGNGCSIKLQYKSVQNNTQSSFGVWCGIDLCKLSCGMQKLYEVTKNNCGELDSPALDQKLARATTLFTLIVGAIMQPLCDTDVTKLRKELEKLLGLGDCCCAIGINPSNPNVGSGSCCPTSSNVIDIVSGIAPAQCPNSYFPVNVYDPTGTIVIGIATDANSLVALLNATPSWQVYGTAFNEGNCKVGWYTTTSGAIVPVIKVKTTGTGCVGDQQLYIVDMTDVCIPSTVITTASFPLNAWVNFGLGAGPQSLGSVASQTALITALNAVSGKPATITFTAGVGVNQIIIANSSCTAYSGSITITCDAGSSSSLMYGSSHTQEVPGGIPNGSIEAYGLRTNALIGKIPGMPTDNSPWHMIRIGNYVITAEGDTGLVYFYDMTNPLMPSLARTIQLTTVVGGPDGNFTNTPTSLGLGSSVVNSIYSLYFPTDTYGLMSLSAMYIFEGKTGTAWKLDFYAAGSGVTAAFQDDKLIGKCPRVMHWHITNATIAIYFTQDGTLETDIAGVSTILEGYIVTLDLSDFSSGGLTSQQILLNENEYVWAATYDGVDTIWFLGQNGTWGKYSVASNTVTARYGNGLGTYLSSARPLSRRGNCKFYVDRIFVASLNGFNPISAVQGALWVSVASLPTTPAATMFTGNGTAPSYFAHNVLPLGNCLVAVTIDSLGLFTSNGSILIYKTDGTFLEACNLNANQALYNLIAFSGVGLYTPNTLV